MTDSLQRRNYIIFKNKWHRAQNVYASVVPSEWGGGETTNQEPIKVLKIPQEEKKSSEAVILAVFKAILAIT